MVFEHYINGIATYYSELSYQNIKRTFMVFCFYNLTKLFVKIFRFDLTQSTNFDLLEVFKFENA